MQEDREREALLSHNNDAEEEQSISSPQSIHTRLPLASSPPRALSPEESSRRAPSTTFDVMRVQQTSPATTTRREPSPSSSPTRVTALSGAMPISDSSEGGLARLPSLNFRTSLQRDLEQNRLKLAATHEEISTMGLQIEDTSRQGKFYTPLPLKSSSTLGLIHWT